MDLFDWFEYIITYDPFQCILTTYVPRDPRIPTNLFGLFECALSMHFMSIYVLRGLRTPRNLFGWFEFFESDIGYPLSPFNTFS